MAVVYLHLNKDTFQPFYIGIGKDKSRAFCRKSRSKFWENIVNKRGYKVYILYKDISWERAVKEEKFLIKWYGRRDLGEGVLCNMTDGGEGNTRHYKLNKIVYKYDLDGNFICSYDSMSEALKAHGKTPSGTLSKAIKNRRPCIGFMWSNFKYKNLKPRPRKTTSKPVLQYTKEGIFISEYKSIREAARITGSNENNIGLACREKRRLCNNFKWKFKNQ